MSEITTMPFGTEVHFFNVAECELSPASTRSHTSRYKGNDVRGERIGRAK